MGNAAVCTKAQGEDNNNSISSSKKDNSTNNNLNKSNIKEKTEGVIAGRWKVTDRQIGKGSFAVVKMGYDIKTKKKVAIRTMPTVGICPVSLEHLRREAEIHPTLDHEGIVKCLYCKEDETSITMVQEYVTDGSLLDYYAKKRALMEFEVRAIFTQLINAVAYMHEQGVVHRDIKADNILIYASTQTIKLADMGFADHFTADKRFTNFPGTLAYSPPEVLQGKPHYGPPRDVWSCGVLLYILLTGKYPFGSQATTKTKGRIINEEPDYTNPKISGIAKDLLCKMLCKDPVTRITLDEIKNHPWIVGGAMFKNTFIRRASSLAGDLLNQKQQIATTKGTEEIKALATPTDTPRGTTPRDVIPTSLANEVIPPSPALPRITISRIEPAEEIVAKRPIDDFNGAFRNMDEGCAVVA